MSEISEFQMSLDLCVRRSTTGAPIVVTLASFESLFSMAGFPAT